MHELHMEMHKLTQKIAKLDIYKTNLPYRKENSFLAGKQTIFNKQYISFIVS